MTIFISQPMSNIDPSDVADVRTSMEQDLKIRGIDFPKSTYDTNVPEGTKHSDIWLLANAANVLANCDGIYMAPHWASSKGCCIEHAIASTYGLPIYYSPISLPNVAQNLLRIPDAYKNGLENEYCKLDVLAMQALFEASLTRSTEIELNSGEKIKLIFGKEANDDAVSGN